MEIATDVAVDYTCKDRELVVRVRVDMPDGDSSPFCFAVEGIGRFLLVENTPPDVQEVIAKVNGASMVFPYIREAIADLTRRAGVPPLHLQPVNFVELMNAGVSEKSSVTGVGKDTGKKRGHAKSVRAQGDNDEA